MKKLSAVILFILISFLPFATAAEQEASTEPKIFIYHIPDDEPLQTQDNLIQKEIHDIISDDVTADTAPSLAEEEEETDKNPSSFVKLSNNDEESDIHPNVLKGYAVYEVEEGEPVTLDDSVSNYLSISIFQPYNFKGGKYSPEKQKEQLNYSKFSNMEYSIAPISSGHSKKFGGFTTGTTFNQMIDTAELEQSTGIFSRYDTKYFAIYTAYSKTLNSTNSNYNDNLYISPELKLNQYFTLKEILSTDITKNRKKAEFVISINPFGKKDIDRLRIEFGANATYDDTNSLLKNQFKFSTQYKW